MSKAGSWVFAHPLRAACVNIALFILLLGVSGSGGTIQALGTAALCCAGAIFVAHAWRAPSTDGVFAFILTWVPGVLALALLPLAIGLAAGGGAGMWLGLALMAVELALLALATVDAGRAGEAA
jgi:hypothetical protein